MEVGLALERQEQLCPFRSFGGCRKQKGEVQEVKAWSLPLSGPMGYKMVFDLAISMFMPFNDK